MQTKDSSVDDTITRSDYHKLSRIWQPGSRYAAHLAFWQQPQSSLSIDSITLNVPGTCIDELDHALPDLSKSDQLCAKQLAPLTHCQFFCEKIIDHLENKAGAVLIDRFPVERYSARENERLCQVMSSLIAPLMEQSHTGTLLYHVKNEQPVDPNKVRKSITNLGQPYHTDGGWHTEPARYIGLFCLNNAKSGGSSKLTSLIAAYQALYLSDKRKLLSTLAHPMPWNRQGEHAPEDKKTQDNPAFEIINDEFVGRYYESYVRTGFELTNSHIPDELNQALIELKRAIDAQAAIEFDMLPGQFQYINNRIALHARSAFDDDGEQDGRDLIRVWNR